MFVCEIQAQMLLVEDGEHTVEWSHSRSSTLAQLHQNGKLNLWHKWSK